MDADSPRRLDWTATLLAVSQTVGATLDLTETMRRVARETGRVLGADMVGAYLASPDGRELRPIAGYHVPEPLRADFARFPFPLSGHRAVEEARDRREAVWTSDASADPRIDRETLARFPHRSVLFAPMFAQDEFIGGLFAVWWTEARTFTAEDVQLAGAVSQQAAIAVKNARLYEEAERRRQEAVQHLERERTARELAQRVANALQQSEERHRAIVEGSIQGILIHKDHVVRFANRALMRLFAWNETDEAAGQSVDAFLPPSETARLLAIREARRKGEAVPFRYEVQAIRRDGVGIWLDCFVSRISWDGEPATLVTMVDITERKETEAALRESEEQLRHAHKMEAVGRLAGGVAHDFNNLLTVIRGRAQLGSERLDSSHSLRRDLDLIRSTAERAITLTSQLLAFSRRQVLQPKVLSLNGVVTGLEGLLRRLIGEDIDLVTRLEPALGPVRADPAQLEQVVMNLAVNARDAMPRGGQLTLETRNVELDGAHARRHAGLEPGPYAVLAVTDTGAGMDADTLAHIFEPFFTTKEQGKGTGLGLATVYGIIEQSGGHIRAESEPDRGTTFEIYLPRVKPADGAAAPARGPGRARGGSETILLVEDEADVRELARELLRMRGYAVLEARDVLDALRIAEEHPGAIHLLLTDVVMPKMSGRQLAERATARRPEMRVLYMSGYTDDAIVHHGVIERAVAFLQKPFSGEALARKVREVLDASW